MTTEQGETFLTESNMSPDTSLCPYQHNMQNIFASIDPAAFLERMSRDVDSQVETDMRWSRETLSKAPVLKELFFEPSDPDKIVFMAIDITKPERWMWLSVNRYSSVKYEFNDVPVHFDIASWSEASQDWKYTPGIPFGKFRTIIRSEGLTGVMEGLKHTAGFHWIAQEDRQFSPFDFLGIRPPPHIVPQAPDEPYAAPVTNEGWPPHHPPDPFYWSEERESFRAYGIWTGNHYYKGRSYPPPSPP